MANVPENVPISQPKWLVIYILHQECEAITRRFQCQPESEGQWALLRWAHRTWATLLLLEDEVEWAADASIPLFFNIRKDMDDVS